MSWPATALLGILHEVDERFLFSPVLEPTPACPCDMSGVNERSGSLGIYLHIRIARLAVNLAGTCLVQTAIPHIARTYDREVSFRHL